MGAGWGFGDHGEVRVWAELVDDKMLWQEQAAGAEVNTQTEMGFGDFFGPKTSKMASLWAILAGLQK